MTITIKPVTNPKELASYQSDESAAFKGSAEQLYLPNSEADLQAIFKAGIAAKQLLTISGGGTGITGSRCPIHGGWIISTERMTSPAQDCPADYEIITGAGFTFYLNKKTKEAIVPGSIPLSILGTLLEEDNLLYPPDPTEMSATLGGTVATNASGAKSFFYGPTRDWILGLRTVLANGEILDLKRNQYQASGQELEFAGFKIKLPTFKEYPMPAIKNAAGLFIKEDMDAIDLFIGSEGLFGCFTDIHIKLTELVEKTLTSIVYFDNLNEALDFVDSGVTKSSLLPFLSLEFFDENSLDLMRQKNPQIPQAAAAVLFELAYDENSDNTIYPSNNLLKIMEKELTNYQVTTTWCIPYTNHEDIRLFRHSLPEVVNEIVRSRFGKIGTDMAVPHARFREMMHIYQDECAQSEVPYVMFGHIGNDHIHLNFLPDSQEAYQKAKRAYTKIAVKAVALSGTISAEHGVGKKQILAPGFQKTIPYLEIQYQDKGLQIIRDIKKIFDSAYLLNIGNMIPKEAA